MLIEAAETRWHSVLGDIFRSVPHALWRLAGHTGSLLPQEEPTRSSGSMFAEAGGANGALAQTMLTLVFRIIRCEGKPGSLVAPSLVGLRDGSFVSSETQEEVGGDQEEKTATTTRPWSTAAEVLAATAAAAAVGDAESWLGFAGRLVRLFSDQDDALVHMLLTNLYIFHDTRPAVNASIIFLHSEISNPQQLDGLPISASDPWLEQAERVFVYVVRWFSLSTDIPFAQLLFSGARPTAAPDGYALRRSFFSFSMLSSQQRRYPSLFVISVPQSGGPAETTREHCCSWQSELRALYDGGLHPGVLFAALLSEVLCNWVVLHLYIQLTCNRSHPGSTVVVCARSNCDIVCPVVARPRGVSHVPGVRSCAESSRREDFLITWWISPISSVVIHSHDTDGSPRFLSVFLSDLIAWIQGGQGINVSTPCVVSYRRDIKRYDSP